MTDDLTTPHAGADEPSRNDGAELTGAVGPYRILRRLGRGGMGEVYLAEQSEPVRRQVALKVVKLGMDTRDVLERFQSERQALALLNHPSIATMLDAGQTDRGRPYFVMEFVDGVPITQYADAHQLTIDARLDLFMQICAGVQHAHQKALIHRDLKPSNILVTEQDGRPVPKIIDFGIAKATATASDEATAFTQLGQIVGTPLYMSPEQAEPTTIDVDTRTDIYSLGVILYELLVDELPFPREELLAAGYAGMLRVIREKEPPRPSSRLRAVTEHTTSVVRHRVTDVTRLQRTLQGDLDWIVLKALEKDPARRYETAGEFATDVRRYLEQEPVLATPPSRGYRLRKLVRRNRRTFAALGAVAVVLVMATIVSSALWVRAERATRLATLEAGKAKQVSQFLGEMLAGVGPQVAQGRDTKLLREILDKTTERVGRELTNQPEVEATLRLQLGSVYRQLGDYDEAQQQFDRVRELQAEHHLSAPDAAFVLMMAGLNAWSREDMTAAADLLRQAVDRGGSATDVDSLAWAESALHLGNVLAETGELAEADSLMQLTLGVYRRRAPDDDQLAVNFNSLGNLARYQGDLPAAEAHYREALAAHRRIWGDNHPYVAVDLHNLGRLLHAMGNPTEGERLVREALALQRRVFEGPHPDNALAMRSLAEILLADGRLAEADSLARASLEITRNVYGEDSETSIRALISIGDIQKQGRDLTAAEASFREVMAKAAAPRITDPLLLPTGTYRLASTLLSQGRLIDARPYFEQAVELYAKVGGPEHPNTLLARNDYARLLASLGQDETAVAQLREVLAARERILGEHHPETCITRVDLGRSLRRLGQFAEAESQTRRGRDGYRAAMGPDHPGGWVASGHLAVALRDLGRYDEAEQELLSIEPLLRDKYGAGSSSHRNVQSRLSTVYLRAGRQAEADAWYAKALDESAAPLEPRSRAATLRDRGEALLAMEKPDAAEALLRECVDLYTQASGPGNGDTLEATRLLIRTYEALQRPQDAARWRTP